MRAGFFPVLETRECSRLKPSFTVLIIEQENFGMRGIWKLVCSRPLCYSPHLKHSVHVFPLIFSSEEDLAAEAAPPTVALDVPGTTKEETKEANLPRIEDILYKLIFKKLYIQYTCIIIHIL